MSRLEDVLNRPRTETFAEFLRDHRADGFRRKVLAAAAADGVPTDSFVIALADALGYTAAKIDEKGATSTLDDKLHAFCRRVEQAYGKVRSR